MTKNKRLGQSRKTLSEVSSVSGRTAAEYSPQKSEKAPEGAFLKAQHGAAYHKTCIMEHRDPGARRTTEISGTGRVRTSLLN